jgi:simple sugar transport system permease protein
VIIALVTLVMFWLFTRKTALGMFIEAVGINIRAAKNAGVNTRTVVMLAYVLSGVCAAIAGVIVAADIRGADANNAGLWLELDAILAVVIGGASLMGGRFNLLLSVRGADYSGHEYRDFALRLPAGAQPGGESGGGAVRTDCSVAALYRTD